MKITFVLPALDMSGGNRVVAIYARKLTERGHSVFLIAPPRSRSGLKDSARALLRRVALRPVASHLPRPGKSHVQNLNLDFRELDRWRPITESDVPDADVVVATWWETAEWVFAMPRAKGAKVYFIQHHEVFPWLPQERCRATYKLPMWKIVVARWLRDVMRIDYGDGDVEIVPNSVDHMQFWAEPRGKQIVPTVGFLFSRAEFKGIDTTWGAVAKLREQLPQLRVISFGTVPPDSAILAEINFHHDPAQSRLRDLYADCDVWITASRSEGFNLPAMEAMACRTPVVSTRTGWPEEVIVDGINGYCVPVDDVEALADAAYRLLKLPDSQWRAVSEAAFDTVRDSSWDRSCILFENALIRAVEHSRVPISDRALLS